MVFTTLDQVLEVIPLEVLSEAFDVEIREIASKLEFIDRDINTIYGITEIEVSRRSKDSTPISGVAIIKLSLVNGEGSKHYNHSCILKSESEWLPVINRIADNELYGLLDYPQEYVDANKDKDCKIYLFSPEELYRTELVRMKCHSPKYCYQTDSGMHVYQGKPEEGELCCADNYGVIVGALGKLLEFRKFAKEEESRIFRKLVGDSQAQKEYVEVLSAMESVITTMKESSLLDYADLNKLLACHIETLKSANTDEIIKELKADFDASTKKFYDKVNHQIAHVTELIEDFSDFEIVGVTSDELKEALDAIASKKTEDKEEVPSEIENKPKKKSSGRPKKSTKSVGVPDCAKPEA